MCNNFKGEYAFTSDSACGRKELQNFKNFVQTNCQKHDHPINRDKLQAQIPPKQKSVLTKALFTFADESHSSSPAGRTPDIPTRYENTKPLTA
jgi:hypothetical protein